MILQRYKSIEFTKETFLLSIFINLKIIIFLINKNKIKKRENFTKRMQQPYYKNISNSLYKIKHPSNKKYLLHKHFSIGILAILWPTQHVFHLSCFNLYTIL